MAITFVDNYGGDNFYDPGGLYEIGTGRPTVAANDIMIVGIVVNADDTGAVPGWTSPSGWNQLWDRYISAGGTSYHFIVEWKRASGSEPSSYTWSWSTSATNSTYADVAMAVYRGANTGTVIDVSGLGSETTTTTHTAPSVSAAYTNDMWVVVAVEDNYSDWTPASGFTERYDTADHGAMFADKLLSSGGATGTAAFTTGSSGGGIAGSILLIDADPGPTVQITGSAVVNTTHGSGSQAVTIPTDCDAVLAFSWGWRSSTALDFTALNWDGGGMDFTQIVTNKSTADPYDVWAYIMTASSGSWPGTGSQTLHWTFNNAPTEGGTVVIVFLKNVNGSNPIVDTDSQKNTDPDWTGSLTGVGGGDLTFIVAADYNTDNVELNRNGQTILTSDTNDNAVDWGIAYRQAEAAPQAGTADTAAQFVGYITFAIAVTSGGGSTQEVSLSLAIDAALAGSAGASAEGLAYFGANLDANALSAAAAIAGLEISAIANTALSGGFSSDVALALGILAAVAQGAGALAGGAVALNVTAAQQAAGQAGTEGGLALDLLAQLAAAAQATAEESLTFGVNNSIGVAAQAQALGSLALGVMGTISQAGEAIAAGDFEVALTVGAGAALSFDAQAAGFGAVDLAVSLDVADSATAQALSSIALGVIGAANVTGAAVAGGTVDVSVTLGAGASVLFTGAAVAEGAVTLDIDALTAVTAQALAAAGLDLDAALSITLAGDKLAVGVTPADRVNLIGAEDRTLVISGEGRTLAIKLEDRTLTAV